ncbi:hypothetical protein Tco_1299359, partial [Tanacetum coccineum]
SISAIEDTWERRGIANMAFIQLGGNSRVDEMILARVLSGFAGEKVWEDIQVVTSFVGARKMALWEGRQFCPLKLYNLNVISARLAVIVPHLVILVIQLEVWQL